MKRLLLLALVGMSLQACPPRSAVPIMRPATTYICQPIQTPVIDYQEYHQSRPTDIWDVMVGLTIIGGIVYCLGNVVESSVATTAAKHVCIPYYGD